MMVILAILSWACKKDYDPCGHTVYRGYVVGAGCEKIFVLSTLSPIDTIATDNLPDSVYHLLTSPVPQKHGTESYEFLFRPEYQNKFPVTFTYEVSDEMGDGCLRPDISGRKNHFDRAVSKHVKIRCIVPGF
jgi:hypothetical protein